MARTAMIDMYLDELVKSFPEYIGVVGKKIFPESIDTIKKIDAFALIVLHRLRLDLKFKARRSVFIKKNTLNFIERRPSDLDEMLLSLPVNFFQNTGAHTITKYIVDICVHKKLAEKKLPEMMYDKEAVSVASAYFGFQYLALEISSLLYEFEETSTSSEIEVIKSVVSEHKKTCCSSICLQEFALAELIETVSHENLNGINPTLHFSHKEILYLCERIKNCGIG